MKESQGQLANKHGIMNRKSAANELLSHGFEEIGPIKANPLRASVLEEFKRCRLSSLARSSKVFAAKVVVCRSIVNTEFSVNFLVQAAGWPEPMALVCRTQNNGGTAYERFEHLYANLAERVPCRSLILLALTPSDSLSSETIEAVYERAESWVKRSKGRIAKVFRGSDVFRRWLSDYAPWPDCPASEMFV